MIKLSASETKWSSLLVRTRVLMLYISICIYDLGPEKLPGLARYTLFIIRIDSHEIIYPVYL